MQDARLVAIKQQVNDFLLMSTEEAAAVGQKAGTNQIYLYERQSISNDFFLQ